MSDKNCVELVRPFVETLNERGITNVQLFGGIGSCALGHPDTEIIPAEQLVVAPGDLYLPQYRDPKGRNLRDLDCLVKSAQQEKVDAVETIAQQALAKPGQEHRTGKKVETELEISIFGLRPMAQLMRQINNPALSFVKNHVADRYVIQDSSEVVMATKALAMFGVDMPLSTLETWRLQIGDDELTFPIPHPGATVLNYLTRSISGLRPKDAKKVHALTRTIAAKAPEIIDWITEGDGASQLDFGRILHTIREPREGARPLLVGGVIPVKPYALEELPHHPACLVRDRPRVAEAWLAAEHLKSSGMFNMEKRPRVVSTWQEHIEPHIQRVIKNS